jgi:ubiquinone/menaquinone biosynthesis C-methylase UbiE
MRSRTRRRLRAYPPEYWSQLAGQWDRVVDYPRNPHQLYYREADLLISRALTRRMRVLELGCGTGLSTAIHAKEVSHIVATDFAEGMLRLARRKLSAGSAGEKVRLAVCNAQQLPFRAASFDAVVSRGVMMSYVEDPRRVLAEMHRILRPKGFAAFDVMNLLHAPSRRASGGAFLFLGRTPTYQETRLREGRQVRRIFLLPRRASFLAAARSRKVVHKRPEAVTRGATSVETYEGRMFRRSDVEALLKVTGFRGTRVTPLGHLAYLLGVEDRELSEFVRDHRDRLPRLALGLSAHLRTETALHLFVTATKR